MRRYLCLYFPQWPLQCLLRTKPELSGEPIVLFERTARGKRVFLASKEATQYGIRDGMPLVEATTLCRAAIQQEIDLAANHETLKNVALWFLRFSPLVGVETTGVHAPYPEALFLDVTGCEGVYGGEERLVKTALKICQRNTLRARVALAPTLGMAWGMAHAGENAQIIDEIDQAEEALKTLPIGALRIDPEILQQLQPLGLHTIEDLSRQPRASLPSRFGPMLLQRLDHALGRVGEVMPLIRPAPEFREAREFEYPIRNWELLFKVLEEMVTKLSQTLRRSERGARQLECWLYHELAEPLKVEVSLHTSSARQKHLWQLLRTKLEDVFCRPKRQRRKKVTIQQTHRVIDAEEGVSAVAFHVPSTDALSDGQLSLFSEDKGEEASGSLALLLDKLVTRLGPTAVLRVGLQDEHIPERAVRVYPLNEKRSDLQPTESLIRPLTLFATPIAVQIDQENRLSGFGNALVIKMMEGPERIESGWWNDNDVHRDYFRAITFTGEQLWVFEHLTNHQWFVHGAFD